MVKLFGELLFGLVRFLFVLLMESFVAEAARKFMAWLDPKVQGRRTKFIIGGLLGIAAYFLFPIVMSLLLFR
ncbi:hypothetical protein BH10PSE11_BH10PSE11_03120 [soil metagenome]